MRGRKTTYWVYILTNRSGTLYVGMTSRLGHRLQQHAEGTARAFTSRYAIGRLIYVESFGYVWDAIARERQLKGWSRTKKVALINSINPTWRDIAEDLMDVL